MSSAFEASWCRVRMADGSAAELWVQPHAIPGPGQWVIAGRLVEDCASVATCTFIAAQGEFEREMLIERMAEARSELPTSATSRERVLGKLPRLPGVTHDPGTSLGNIPQNPVTDEVYDGRS